MAAKASASFAAQAAAAALTSSWTAWVTSAAEGEVGESSSLQADDPTTVRSVRPRTTTRRDSSAMGTSRGQDVCAREARVATAPWTDAAASKESLAVAFSDLHHTLDVRRVGRTGGQRRARAHREAGTIEELFDSRSADQEDPGRLLRGVPEAVERPGGHVHRVARTDAEPLHTVRADPSEFGRPFGDEEGLLLRVLVRGHSRARRHVHLEHAIMPPGVGLTDPPFAVDPENVDHLGRSPAGAFDGTLTTSRGFIHVAQHGASFAGCRYQVQGCSAARRQGSPRAPRPRPRPPDPAATGRGPVASAR